MLNPFNDVLDQAIHLLRIDKVRTGPVLMLEVEQHRAVAIYLDFHALVFDNDLLPVMLSSSLKTFNSASLALHTGRRYRRADIRGK
jgi:hypothetical protein